MNTPDDALSISNPRLLAAVYFSVLAMVATIIIDTLLYVLGMEQIVPAFKAIIWAVVVAGCFGALFGERIIYTTAPYKKHAFAWAFLMVIVALPVYNIGLVYLLKDHHAHLFAHATFLNLLYLYLFVLLYSFILAGVWLAIVAGFAAIYLRSYIVYYILDSLSIRQETTTETVIHNKTAQSGQTSISSNKTNPLTQYKVLR